METEGSADSSRYLPATIKGEATWLKILMSIWVSGVTRMVAPLEKMSSALAFTAVSMR